jgi:diguanylate cyclase (GGDEF)-like protein
MNAIYVSYFNLLAPVITLAFGGLLVVCWAYLRDQKALLWIAGGYILPALALGAQSLMDDGELARWAVFCAPFYIGGAWCVGHGIALRYETRAHPRIALAIGAIATALSFYYSNIDNNLSLRTAILNGAILMVQILPLPSVFRSPRVTDAWDKTLLWSFVLFSLIIFGRIVVILLSEPSSDIEQLTHSTYWRFLLTSTLFFSLWFICVLLAATISTIVQNLKYDRDHDPLTGLLNRRAFFEMAEHALKQQNNHPATVLTIDIDHFKSINDRFGHNAGDDVLKAVALKLKISLTNGHLCARFGGEEFVVLLKNTRVDQSEAIAGMIRGHFSSIANGNGTGKITASFGAAQIMHGVTLQEALKRADHALYCAKESGRDQIHMVAL